MRAAVQLHSAIKALGEGEGGGVSVIILYTPVSEHHLFLLLSTVLLSLLSVRRKAGCSVKRSVQDQLDTTSIYDT
jgi:hypothetical protein